MSANKAKTDEYEEMMDRMRLDEFILHSEYTNQMEDFPVQLKYFDYPLELEEFSKYKTPLFVKQRREELCRVQQMMRLDMDFMNLDENDSSFVNNNSVNNLEDADLKLLTDSGKQQSFTSNQYQKSVSWLRKNQYLSFETGANNQQQGSGSTTIQYQSLYNNAKMHEEQSQQYKSVEHQKKYIENSFKAANSMNVENIKSAVKKPPNVYPVSIHSVLPMFVNESLFFSHVSFDIHPLFADKKTYLSRSVMEDSFLRGMKDKDENEYVGYYINSGDVVGDEDEKAKNEYMLIRKYDWNISSNKVGIDDNFVLTKVNNANNVKAMYYHSIPTRIKLKRKVENNSVYNRANVNSYNDDSGEFEDEELENTANLKNVQESEMKVKLNFLN